jgi:hypothetical protein
VVDEVSKLKLNAIVELDCDADDLQGRHTVVATQKAIAVKTVKNLIDLTISSVDRLAAAMRFSLIANVLLSRDFFIIEPFPPIRAASC